MAHRCTWLRLGRLAPWSFALVCGPWVGAGCGRAPPPPPAAPSSVVSPQIDATNICGGSKTDALDLIDADKAQFTIASDGATMRNGKVKDFTVALFGAGDRAAPHDAIVRVDALSAFTQPPAQLGRTTLKACGVLPAKKVLRLPPLDGVDVWRVTVYLDRTVASSLSAAVAPPDDDGARQQTAKNAETRVVLYNLETALKGQLEMAISSSEQAAFDAERAQGAIPATNRLDQFTNAAKNLSVITQKRQPKADYDAALKAAEKKFPLSAAGLDEVEKNLTQVDAALQAVNAATDKYTASTKQIASRHPSADDLAKEKSLRKQWYDAARGVLDSVRLPNAPTTLPDGTSDKVCREVQDEKDGANRAWLLGAFDLPSTDFEHTVEIRADRQFTQTVKLPPDEAIGIWATHAPADATSFSVAISGQSSRTDPVQVLASFVSAVASAAAPKAAATGGELAVVEHAQEIESWLEKLVSSCTSRPAGVQDPTAAIAPFRSWARDVAGDDGYGLKRDWTYVVRSCLSATCTSGSSDFGPVTLTTPPGLGLTLIGAFTYGWNTGGSQHPPAFPSYQWRPTMPGGTVEQTFSLDEVPQPGASIAGSLLLTMLMPECKWGRAGIGLGPSLIDGTGKALQQWTANVVLRPKTWFSDNLYLVLGVGFRLIDMPLAYRPGQTVTLPFATTGAPPNAPALTTRTDYDGVITFGFGIDLAVLGTAANSIFGSKVNVSVPSTAPAPPPSSAPGADPKNGKSVGGGR
jgi:hypothetical protein